ncbi:MAG: CmpA/NrtA family ABC transporter substrate-binding protein [Pseudomonadota bacterium]
MAHLDHIAAGFLPLTDCAILVAAREIGFAEDEGIDLALVRETSWANIRDRMAVGHFEAAHMLAPMPVAANLGLTPMPAELVAPMALGLGGNAVTVSTKVWNEMRVDEPLDIRDPDAIGAQLKRVIETRKKAGDDRLRFGVVHPHSGHNLELRYWLDACAIAPDTDIEIVIVPPPLMADALKNGRIDGFCVGEPWNSIAVDMGVGRIATVKAAIWRSSPEKVLTLRSEWQRDHEELTSRLLRALHRAAEWCGDVKNKDKLAAILARDTYVSAPKELVERALSGNLVLEQGLDIALPDFFLPFERAATFPWQSHALWFYSQLVRWGIAPHNQDNATRARQSYRPDLYRRALKPLRAGLPSANAKVEGALERETPVGATHGTLVLGPDGFFDGRVFDPDKLDDYVAGSLQSPA